MNATTLKSPNSFLALLGHELRWQIVAMLTVGDYRAQEIVKRLKEPANLVSYHLKQLRTAGLVSERRSSADGRDVYYSLNLEKLRNLFLASGEALHPALTEPVAASEKRAHTGKAKPVRVLFLCTHNSARSQMAEALARNLGKGRIEAFSAGTEPSTVHADAIRAMADLEIDIRKQRSKSMTEFFGQSFDYVITVCDNTREACPIFPGQPVQMHWSFADPAAVESPRERLEAFRRTATELTTRIRNLLLLIERDNSG